jgi:hypothetical protein
VLEVLVGLGGMSVAELGRLQAQFREEQDVWRRRSRKASGQLVIKGAGRRGSLVRIRPMPGRRDPTALAEADKALRTISRHLGEIERELARRAAGEAARA